MKSILETKTRTAGCRFWASLRDLLDCLAVVVGGGGRHGGKIVHQLAVHLERLDDVPLVVEQCLARGKMKSEIED